MTRGQRIVLIACSLAVAGTSLYVPWKHQYGAGGTLYRALGYAFLWSPPDWWDPASVDLGRTILQIIAVLSLGIATFFAAPTLEDWLVAIRQKVKDLLLLD